MEVLERMNLMASASARRLGSHNFTTVVLSTRNTWIMVSSTRRFESVKSDGDILRSMVAQKGGFVAKWIKDQRSRQGTLFRSFFGAETTSSVAPRECYSNECYGLIYTAAMSNRRYVCPYPLAPN